MSGAFPQYDFRHIVRTLQTTGQDKRSNHGPAYLRSQLRLLLAELVGDLLQRPRLRGNLARAWTHSTKPLRHLFTLHLPHPFIFFPLRVTREATMCRGER